MDIDLARTFLEIVRHGSLAAAAQKLFVTQTGSSTPGCRSSKSAGQHAVRAQPRRGETDGQWRAFVVSAPIAGADLGSRAARLPLLDGYRNVLHIGGEVSLCNPLMLSWAAELREKIPGTPCAWKSATAKTSCASSNSVCSMRAGLSAGILARLQVEQVLEEKLILAVGAKPPGSLRLHRQGRASVASTTPPCQTRPKPRPQFQPRPAGPAIHPRTRRQRYFRTRVVRSYREARWKRPSPNSGCPTYLVYARERDSATLQQAFDLLRQVIETDDDWSQRWNPLS
jgi:hypothetical protein